MRPAEKNVMDKRTGGQSRTVTITLRLPTVISGLFMLCAGFVAVFSLGILLGRGHNLEARIPQLERIMPQAAQPQQPMIVEQGEASPAGQSANPADGGTGAEASRPPGAAEPRNQVMDQGDLAYRDALKQRRRPAGQKQDASRQRTSGDKVETPAGKKSGSAKQPREEGAAGKRELFAYVYQVAAYREAAMSDRLADKLNAAGVRARTEKSREGGGVWYKTVVDFRGSPDDTDGLRAKLKAQGLDRLILRSKVPTR